MGKFRIAVLVKQVTDTRTATEAKVNADGVIDRNSLPAICNPDDLKALEQALRIKERMSDCEVTLISMGPQRAEEVLHDGIYRGADNGILLSDRRFAGADTLATSYALSRAIIKVNADLVFAGRQSIDGDTAHVGPQTAQMLGWPQVTYVEQVTDIADGFLTAQRRTDEGVEITRTALPALLTVGGEADDCRQRNVRRLLDMRKEPLTYWTANDLGGDIGSYGLGGSPTQVVNSRTIVAEHKDTQVIGCEDEALSAFAAHLVENHIVE